MCAFSKRLALKPSGAGKLRMDDGKQASHVGAGLRHGDSGLESGEGR